ncbi:MAG TPA: RNA polymerase sigma factor [Fimbriimonadaceae bacterium]|nr:RNA polymerase sigma factor [Fimbriimonadaceae bacterium]
MIRLSVLREGAVRRLASSEQKQVVAAQSGDREAFDGLVSSHEREIRKFVLKRVQKEHADDLLQDVWLAAWTSIGEFDSRSRFRTWLYGIAINKCKSYYRSQQRGVAHLSLDDVIPERMRSAPPESDLEAMLPSLLEMLSDNHRQLLDLYYYGELTLPEISRLLDRNLNTVKYQFYRAHTELAQLIDAGGAK